MNILGISAFYHDSAAALLQDGKIISAAQEERFSRKKHDAGFPHHAINYVLESNNCDMSQIDYIAFYDKPLLKFERLLETYIAKAPRGFKSFRMAMPIWLREKLFLKDFLFKECNKLDPNFTIGQIKFCEHHFSHAASAFYPSPFEEAVVLTLDGVGEWATTSVAIGKNKELDIKKELHFPHSLGLLYSAFTYYTGFRVNSGEYKLMGLAPYGEPKYVDLIKKELVDLKADGSFRLNQSYFDYASGLTMTNTRFSNLFGEPVRKPDKDELTQFHMDLAASIQVVTEDIVLLMTKNLAEEYGVRNLCMAGGVALNCVANGKILRSGYFENVWIQPAAGDAGGALGAAQALWHHELGHDREAIFADNMQGSYLGPNFDDNQINDQLTDCKAIYEQLEYKDMIDTVAHLIESGKVVGWFQGRMEFGPRALGARSILGDPRSPDTQTSMNLKIKYRESFRPFAPSILAEHAENWFDHKGDSPYMLIVADVQENQRNPIKSDDAKLRGLDSLKVNRSSIPAVTHVDYSARIQTVHKETNPRYYDLISKFNELTSCPILVNTSFNVRGEPIVCTPEDAFNCFMGTEMDVLVIENFILLKEQQDPALKADYKSKYKLD